MAVNVADLILTGLGTGTISLVVGHLLGIRQRRTTLADLETQIAERLMQRMDKELADALVTVDRLSTEVADLKRRLEALGEREQQLVAENAALRAERDRLRTELAAREAELAAKAQEIGHLMMLNQAGQASGSSGQRTPTD